MTLSDSLSPCSTSPRVSIRGGPSRFPSSNSCGAPGLSASSGSRTNGSGSYCTSISVTARSAVSTSTAATAATASPLKRTRSLSAYWRWPQIMTFGASRWVITARTPGNASALAVSMRAMRACAWGLRITFATSIPGRSMSPVYLARPVTRSTASMFGPRLPITRIGPPAIGCWAMSISDVYLRRSRLRARHPRRRHHRLENLLVRRAPAQVAAQRLAHLVFGGARHAIEQRLGRHDLAGGAETALEPAVLDKCLLNRMQGIVIRETLNRQHFPGRCFDGERGAGIHVPAIQDHGAGAALGAITPHLRAGQLQVFAEELEQGGAVGDVLPVADAVDPEIDARPPRVAVDRIRKLGLGGNGRQDGCGQRAGRRRPAFPERPARSRGPFLRIVVMSHGGTFLRGNRRRGRLRVGSGRHREKGQNNEDG